MGKSKQNEMTVLRWKQMSRGAMAAMLLTGVSLGAPQILAPQAFAQSASLKDHTPSGWTRDSSLTNLKIDRYAPKSGSMRMDLLAFPETDKSAKAWSLSFIDVMTKPDSDEGLTVHVMEETDPASRAKQGVDVSTHGVMVVRPGRARKNLFMRVRTIVRKGEPVQVTLIELLEGTPSNSEYDQANDISYAARLPVNQPVAMLGLDNMIEVMTSGLVYPDRAAPKPVADAGRVAQSKAPAATASKSTTAPSQAKVTPAKAPVSQNGKAPVLRNMPGPRVKMTRGKMLKSVPAGYRMHVSTTNYWTNDSMTATRRKHLKLTKDGQFEKSNFSISGGMGGVTGVVTESDKNGSFGSVSGSTNPGGNGTVSQGIVKREGLDPTKYGAYYISGNTIELRYANGEVETHKFTTDGYYSFELDGKRYFANAPKGWERKDRERDVLYRSIDGAYLASVYPLKNDVEDGKALLTNWLQKMKDRGEIVSNTPLKFGEVSVYKYVRTVATYKNGVKKDVYLRYEHDSALIEITRYKGASGHDTLIDFVRYVD